MTFKVHFYDGTADSDESDPNLLTPVLEEKLRNFSEAVVNKPPLCSGTWEIPAESFQLSFRKGDEAGCVEKVPFPFAQLMSEPDGLILDGDRGSS